MRIESNQIDCQFFAGKIIKKAGKKGHLRVAVDLSPGPALDVAELGSEPLAGHGLGQRFGAIGILEGVVLLLQGDLGEPIADAVQDHQVGVDALLGCRALLDFVPLVFLEGGEMENKRRGKERKRYLPLPSVALLQLLECEWNV